MILPSSVIQRVIASLQDIHDISQLHLLHRLNENLAAQEISKDNRKKVVDVMKTEDLFCMCNSQVLKTDQRRKTFYKDNFKYVDHIPICLGKNESGMESFSLYVPIKQALEALFSSESVREQHRKTKSEVRTKHILCDNWDGRDIKENRIFRAKFVSRCL